MKYLILLSILFARPIFGAVIPITKDVADLTLGAGVDPVLEKAFEKCIDFDKTEVESEDAAIGTYDLPASAIDFETKNEVITSNQEASKYLNFSISARAKGATYSGSASYSSTEKSYERSDRLTVGMRAVADYGRWFLKSYTLKPKYEKLANTDKEKFFATCGKEFIVGYRLGQGISVMLSSSNDLEYSYKNVAASFSASGGGGGFSGSASAQFNQIAESMMKYGSLEVTVKAIGTGVLSTGSVFMKNKADAEDFSAKVEKFLAGLSASTAVKTEYITRPYPIVSLREYDSMAAEQRRFVIESLYLQFMSLKDDLKHINEYVISDLRTDYGQLCEVDNTKFCDHYLEEMTNRKKGIESAIESVFYLMKKCVKDSEPGNCRTANIDKMYPNLKREFLWPKQFKRLLYEAALRDIVSR